jgi:hypothetical protein
MLDNIKLPPGEWSINLGQAGTQNVRIREEDGPLEVSIQNGPAVLVTNVNTGQTFEMKAGQELRNGVVEAFEPQGTQPMLQPVAPSNPPAAPGGGGPSSSGPSNSGPGLGAPGPGLGGPLGVPLGGLQAGGPESPGGSGGDPLIEPRIQKQVA